MIRIVNRYIAQKKVTERELMKTPVSSPGLDELLRSVGARRT